MPDTAGGHQGIFTYECERTWESLTITGDPAARHCDDCDKVVTLCADVREAAERASTAHCVALPTSAVPPRRRTDRIPARDQRAPRTITLGNFYPINSEGWPSVGWLVPLDGPARGHTFKLRDDTTTIGSDAACDIVIEGERVAREHCAVVASPEGFTLVDRGSSAGTFVGDQRVETYPLIDGDVIVIGGTSVAFKSVM